MSKVSLNLSWLWWGALMGMVGPLTAQIQRDTSHHRTDTLTAYWQYALAVVPERYTDDTTLHKLHEYHAAAALEDHYAWQGNPGSAAMRLVWQPPSAVQGLSLGIDAYAPYLVRPEDLRLYEGAKPYTRLYYAQASTRNIVASATVGHALSRRWRYTFHYDIINQLGVYSHQAVRNTRWHTVAQYAPSGNRYLATLAWIQHDFRHQENGGIAADSLLVGVPRRLLELVPTRNGQAQSRLRSEHFVLQHRWRLSTPSADSSTISLKHSPPLYLMHRLDYRRQYYRYFDTRPSADYYDIFFTNPRGIRHALSSTEVHNTLSLQQGNWSVEARTEVWRIRQLPTDTLLVQLLLGAQWHRHTGRWQWQAAGYYGVGAANGTWQLNARARWQVMTKWYCQMEAKSLRQLPTWIQQSLQVSGERVWHNTDYALPIQHQFHLSIADSQQRWRLSGRQYLLSRWVYFDREATPRQASGSAGVTQLTVAARWRVGRHWHLDNSVTWQHSPAAYLPLPKWSLAHYWYYERLTFKRAVWLRVGLQARWYSEFRTWAYQPLHTQYYVAADEVPPTHFFPIVHALVEAKVRSFKWLLMAENLGQLYFQRPNYLTRHEPTLPLQVRVGACWILWD